MSVTFYGIEETKPEPPSMYCCRPIGEGRGYHNIPCARWPQLSDIIAEMDKYKGRDLITSVHRVRKKFDLTHEQFGPIYRKWSETK